MRRRRIISFGVLLAIIGSITPLAATSYLAWRIALDKEHEQLERMARGVLARAHTSFIEADDSLRRLEASPLSPCSPAHIAQMRATAIGSPVIEQVSYFEGRVGRCTSGGLVDAHHSLLRPTTDFTLPSGLQVTARVWPQVTPGVRMISAQYGHYSALINPRTLVDAGIDPEANVAVAHTDGLLLADSDPRLSGEMVVPDESDHLVSKINDDALIVAVSEPQSMVTAALHDEQLRLAPLGALVSLLVVGAVVWMSRRQLSPLARLQLAVRRKEFIVHYQPIIDLASGRCGGCEALVRWQQPDGRLVMPDQFISMAERSGLIGQITECVLERVVIDMTALLSSDPFVHIAVNVSAEDIRSGHILDILDRYLHGVGFQPRQLWLEATEHGLMEIGPARDTITRLRERGYMVAIDDFGTGYSSLQYLQTLPLDGLKIDKSFIDTIGRDSVTSSVIEHIIDLARNLGLLSVAEGVESLEQADYLRKHGVDYVQGWLYSKPLNAVDFITFYQRHHSLLDIGQRSAPPKRGPREATSFSD